MWPWNFYHIIWQPAFSWQGTGRLNHSGDKSLKWKLSHPCTAPDVQQWRLYWIKQLISTVNFTVLNESCLCTKEVPTLNTLIGLLSSVNFLMTIKSYSLTKTFPTFITHIRALCTVNSLMSNKVRALSEGLSTFRASVRFLSCVNSLVLDKG